MATIPDKLRLGNGSTNSQKQRRLERLHLASCQDFDSSAALGRGEVLVKVAGCGVCHTDLGYFYDGVPTVQKPPLTLGHEISGPSLPVMRNGSGRK